MADQKIAPFHETPLSPEDPQDSLEKLKAARVNLMEYGCCGPRRTAASVPEDQRMLGCSEYGRCTLAHKGVGRPIVQPFRLYKRGGKVREGYGYCFNVMRMSGQYNTSNEGYVLELLPQGTPVTMRYSEPERRLDGTEIWHDRMMEVVPPPFPDFAQGAANIAEQARLRAQEKVRKERQERFTESVVGISDAGQTITSDARKSR